MSETKRAWLVRILTGGLCGCAALLLIGYINGGISLFGDRFHFRGFAFVDGSMERLFGSETLAVAVQFVLFFLFGALAGVATLPFAEDGRVLAVRSILHFLSMEALFCVGLLVNFAGRENPLPWMAALALVYVSVWLGRWAAWWGELEDIREKLGITPAPSPLRWRESLPSLAFALLLCLLLPLVLRPLDDIAVPLLTAALWPYLLVPAGCLIGGLSLGKRHGFCPLYPAACALLTPAAVALLGYGGALAGGVTALAAALLGVLWGALLRRRRKRP